MEESGKEESEYSLNFTTGNPKGSLVRGTLRLCSELKDALLLAILKVPTYMTAADLCHFLAPYEAKIECIWLLRDVEQRNSYDVLLSIDSVDSSIQFCEEYDGKVFSSLGTDRCRLYSAISVELEGDGLEKKDSREDSMTCPICLDKLSAGGVTSNFAAGMLNSGRDRMNLAELSTSPVLDSFGGSSPMKALIVTLCGHAMHIHCLAQWGDNSCPVCRYGLEPAPASNTCQECETEDSLWMCLICGHVACGRRVNRHALQHFQNTSHTFSVEIENGKVWDYAGDNFVHRLIGASSEGKIVEVSQQNGNRSNVMESEVHVSYHSKVEDVIESYNRRVTKELDKQRTYYEKKLSELEVSSQKRMRSRRLELSREEEQLEKAESSYAKLQSTVEQQRERLTCSEAILVEQKARSVSYKSLHKRLNKECDDWKSKLRDIELAVSKVESEAEQVREQIRDMSLHLNTLEKLQVKDGGDSTVGEFPSGDQPGNKDETTASELAGGAVVGVLPPSHRRRRHGKR